MVVPVALPEETGVVLVNGLVQQKDAHRDGELRLGRREPRELLVVHHQREPTVHRQHAPSNTSVLTVRFSCTSRTPTQGLGPWSIVTCFVVGTCVTSADDEGDHAEQHGRRQSGGRQARPPRRAMVCQPSFNVNPGQLGFVDLRRSD